MQVITLHVDQKGGGKTLLSFLKGHLEKYPSVKAIKRAIDDKKVKINGRVEYFSTHPVNIGDVIEICFHPKKEKPASVVIYEDDELIVFNKASGRTSESFEDYFLVHRLDKETSGVFLMAKTLEMQEGLKQLFKDRLVEKTYVALCDGQIKRKEWIVDNYLGKKATYQGGVLYGKVAKEKGKRAVTHFECIQNGKQAALVLAKPITGRTHQIRVHLKGMGHPVLGDWQYSRHFVCPYHPPRLLLHAKKISFIHPKKKEKLEIEAAEPEDFLETQKILLLQ